MILGHIYGVCNMKGYSELANIDILKKSESILKPDSQVKDHSVLKFIA
jgi:hypothetical protein